MKYLTGIQRLFPIHGKTKNASIDIQQRHISLQEVASLHTVEKLTLLAASHPKPYICDADDLQTSDLNSESNTSTTIQRNKLKQANPT